MELLREKRSRMFNRKNNEFYIQWNQMSKLELQRDLFHLFSSKQMNFVKYHDFSLSVKITANNLRDIQPSICNKSKIKANLLYHNL